MSIQSDIAKKIVIGKLKANRLALVAFTVIAILVLVIGIRLFGGKGSS